MPAIKICGVKDPETARFAAALGVAFIGIVFEPSSTRFVTRERGLEIAQATIEAGAKPVAVFKTCTLEEAMGCGISLIQCHSGPVDLPESMGQFYVNTLKAPIRPGIDYFLLDSDRPGSGTRLESVVIPEGVETFLAGGLTPKNIDSVLRVISPYGVDVSSGVEENGVKQFDLIAQFVAAVRKYD